jgi:hypothetical protein
MPSKYDELHDRYHAILTSKAGTRYERLAAMVFKTLAQDCVVIHDVSLVGESDVAHQIDVKIDVGGKSRHVLLECKDFDVSGDMVGLGIVRNFWAVAEDTMADEAIVLTCNGFTRDAAKFAKAKGIKLAVLRSFEDKDWEGRIKTIVLKIIAVMHVNPSASINVSDERKKQKLEQAMGSLMRPTGISIADPAYLVRGAEHVHINDFLSEQMNKNGAIPVNTAKDKMKVSVPSDGWLMQIGDSAPIAFDSIDLSFDVHKEEIVQEITSSRVVELILSGMGSDDMIIFGDQLERRKINAETGEVI